MKGVLERIGSVEFSWKINLYPDEWNHTILFHDQSYYHKLDLGLIDASVEHRIIPSEQTVLVCDQPRIFYQVPEKSAAFVPQYDSIGHFLLGQLIGCTRYLKTRRRGQVMTCYRFAAALIEWHLSLVYARLTGNHQFRTKLSTIEYLDLDRLMPIGHRNALVSNLNFSDESAMDRILLTAMERMLEEGARLAVMAGETLPEGVFNRLSTFLAEELQSM